jgi:ABC-type Fe3+-hydroxamate transport system substrate-binding protein
MKERKMTKFLSIFLIIAMLFTLAACGQKIPQPSTDTRTITDALGRKVEIPAEVNKIVTLRMS